MIRFIDTLKFQIFKFLFTLVSVITFLQLKKELRRMGIIPLKTSQLGLVLIAPNPLREKLLKPLPLQLASLPHLS